MLLLGARVPHSSAETPSDSREDVKAPAPAHSPAQLTSPLSGASLPGANVTFTWSTGMGATRYELRVATKASGANVANINTTSTSAQVTGLPTDGRTIYVWLSTKYASTEAWQKVPYTFTAYTPAPPVLAQLTSPPTNSTLPGRNVPFQWTAAPGATQYQLDVGTAPGATNIASITELGTSTLVSGVPTDGRPIYARLWTKYATTSQAVPYTFSAVNNSLNSPAQLTSPTNGATLAGAAMTFSWSPGFNATQYQLDVSTFQGGTNITTVNTGTTTSALVSGIPVDGRTIYARLWTKYADTWGSTLYSFTAGGISSPAQLSSPASGATLSGASVTFNWLPGVNATQYQLDVSTYQGGTNITTVNTGSETSALVSGIPVDGRTIYARLWTKYAANWDSVLYSFTAATPPSAPAQLTSPMGGSTLSGAAVTFTWSPGLNATQYQLDVSTVQGGTNITMVNTGSATSAQVTGIPVDGRPIYVRLWTKYASTWEARPYSFIAAVNP